MVPKITDKDCAEALWNLLTESQKELHTLRVSIARLAQAMELGRHIPKVRSEETGDEMDIDMQEAPFQVLCMAAITDRGWNALVAEMVGWALSKDNALHDDVTPVPDYGLDP